MEPEALDHLSRIGGICDQLSQSGVWDLADCQRFYDRLSAFDQQFWPFIRYLSLPLYEETSALLKIKHLMMDSPVTIDVVMAVHHPEPDLLRLSIESALNQVGVRVHLHLSLDGPDGNLPVVETVLAEIDSHGQSISLYVHQENRGVGVCRNEALQHLGASWFTFLDSDDLFHPLRLLHASYAIREMDVEWLTTSCSRVSVRQQKLILVNQGLSSIGFNSFLARRDVIESYGYFAPLRYWEDTEYQQRLAIYGARVQNCAAVGHYANGEISPSRSSLGRRWRQEAHAIEGHPWLCGTVRGEMDASTLALRDYFLSLYQKLDRAELTSWFPAVGDSRVLADISAILQA